MEFGPTDRSEFIELKGLEEHEREREGTSLEGDNHGVIGTK